MDRRNLLILIMDQWSQTEKIYFSHPRNAFARPLSLLAGYIARTSSITGSVFADQRRNSQAGLKP